MLQEQYWDADGGELGETAATATPQPSWWENLINAGTQIATSVTQVKAAQQIAKTGQVPTAQLNVGVAPDTTRNLMIAGGIALAAAFLFFGNKRRRR